MGVTHDQRRRDRANGQPSYRSIRYADDFVVLVRGTEAQAHAIKQQTAEFMAEHMRLVLSPEKTHVTHVDDGFDLLGFRIVRNSGVRLPRSARSLSISRHLASRDCLGDAGVVASGWCFDSLRWSDFRRLSRFALREAAGSRGLTTGMSREPGFSAGVRVGWWRGSWVRVVRGRCG